MKGSWRLAGLTLLALCAFAANSILCRLALRSESIDPASFTAIRLVSGALFLALLVSAAHKRSPKASGDWISGSMLFAYAAAFSFAYVALSAGTGALLLFGAVQITMYGFALVKGERPSAVEWIGLFCALAGLIYLVAPGLEAPPLVQAALMILAGVAWGIYSLRGRGIPDPVLATAGNFVRSTPLVILPLLIVAQLKVEAEGIILAIVSGAITSGSGYVVWYMALPALGSTRAAVVQLTVPLLAAFAGILFLGEVASLRLGLAAALILAGVGFAIWGKSRRSALTPAVAAK